MCHIVYDSQGTEISFLWHFLEMRWGVSFFFCLTKGGYDVKVMQPSAGSAGCFGDQSGPMAGYPDMPGEAWVRVQ